MRIGLGALPSMFARPIFALPLWASPMPDLGIDERATSPSPAQTHREPNRRGPSESNLQIEGAPGVLRIGNRDGDVSLGGGNRDSIPADRADLDRVDAHSLRP